ncbi:phage tail protein [Clostridium uliginosum]|uniref:Cell wall binding repeat-containing protein n=1 Tax=Clostridium uliginosum TaxID=119641 RepID=A0A1I1KAI7_9CLOT|nr:phage tail protein [Clostridium uliginosum]SFC57937.1 hypothetical protein SAMN05421842_105136 [Clostridium uliginosum]
MIKKLITSLLIAISIIGITPIAASATWKQNSNNTWSWEENGTYIKGWKQIDGEWYNFGNNGIMQTSWMGENGVWYYCWSNGMMAHNSWLTNGGYWYYFDEGGKMVMDKITVDNTIYDFTSPTIITSKSVDSLPVISTSTLNK